MISDTVPVFWHYAKTQPPPITYARTVAEMGYAVSLQPCPSCGERETPRLTMMGQGDRWTYVCDCTRCGARRSHVFATHGDPAKGPRPRRHLGEGFSEIIPPPPFAAEIDRLAPSIAPDPTKLSGAAFRKSFAVLDRTLTTAYELEKFPDDQLVVPRAWAHGGRSPRQTISDERARISALFDQYVAAQDAAQARTPSTSIALSPARLPASSVVELALASASLAAIQDTAVLLAEVPEEGRSEKLDHAIKFAAKAVTVERTTAARDVAASVADAKARGFTVPSLPSAPSDWNAWRAALDTAMAPFLNELAPHIRAISASAFDLVRARNHLSRVAYVRAASPDDARLSTAAQQVSARAHRARAELEDALDLLEIPAVQTIRDRVGAWAREEARTSMTANTRLDDLPFAALVDSNSKLVAVLRELAAALPR